MSDPEWLQAARGLFKRVVGEPETRSASSADQIGEALDRLPHADHCSTGIAFSPAACDCGRDMLVGETRTNIARFLAVIHKQETTP